MSSFVEFRDFSEQPGSRTLGGRRRGRRRERKVLDNCFTEEKNLCWLAVCGLRMLY